MLFSPNCIGYILVRLTLSYAVFVIQIVSTFILIFDICDHTHEINIFTCFHLLILFLTICPLAFKCRLFLFDFLFFLSFLEIEKVQLADGRERERNISSSTLSVMQGPEIMT